MEIAKELFGTFFIAIVGIYMLSRILNKKIDYKNKNMYLGFIFIYVLTNISYMYFTNFIKLVIATIITFFGCKIIFKDTFNRTLCATIISQIIFIISEMIFITMITIITNFDAEMLLKSFVGNIVANMGIAVISLLIINFNPVQIKAQKITSIMENTNNKMITILIVISIVVINLLLGSIYNQVDLIVLMIINTSFISLVIYAVYNNLTTRNKALIAEKKNIYYEAENNALLNTLNEYERIADQHRVINHENKNQLCALKQMVENNDSEEEIIGYVNKLLNDKKKSDETVLAKTKRIPSGGLQGIVYQKLMIMKKKKIKYSLNISRDLKELDFRKLGIETNVDMCKVIGVFLDNAIEEIKGMKEKIIDIELYKEESTFCIGITNNFGKNKKWEEIDELGYSSKGEGHGYGLSLVKQILESNNRLKNERKITGKYFTQILKIHDMK